MNDIRDTHTWHEPTLRYAKSMRGMIVTGLAYRYTLIRWALIPAVAAVILVLLMPRRYTTYASFVPQPRSASTSSLPGLAATLGVMLPIGADLTESPQFYADLADSRRILEAVVDSLYTVPDEHGVLRTQSLADWFEIDHWAPARRREETIRKLDSKTSVRMAQKTGLITISVTTDLPALSQEITAHFLQEINRFNLESRQSKARAERAFTEQRVQELGADLRNAEDRAEAFAQTNRGYPLPPRLALQQDRLTREVSMRQDIYTAMTQSYEQAKIDEIRDTPVITVVQRPEMPAESDRRHLVQKTFIALCLGLVFGFAVILLRGGYWKVHGLADDEQDVSRIIRGDVMDDLRHPLRALGRIVGGVKSSKPRRLS